MFPLTSKLPVLCLAALAMGQDAPQQARPERVKLEFHPPPGLSLTKTFFQTMDVKLVQQTYRVAIDGVRQSESALPGEIHLVEDEASTFVDTYDAVQDGGFLSSLSRRFKKLRRTSELTFTDADGAPRETREEHSSPLEGAQVSFVWNPEGEGYGVSYTRGGHEAAWLDGLALEADLVSFLPPLAVRPGDSWQVHSSAFSRVYAPGGDLRIEDDPDLPELSSQFDEQLIGTIEATFVGTREVEGRTLFDIRLHGKLTTRVGITGEWSDQGGVGPEIESYQYGFDIEGLLVWDNEAGHAISLKFGGALQLDAEFRQVAETPRGLLENSTQQHFVGSYDLRVFFR